MSESHYDRLLMGNSDKPSPSRPTSKPKSIQDVIVETQTEIRKTLGGKVKLTAEIKLNENN